MVCTIGPVTNLALALRRAPDLVTKVRGLVVAGGRLGPDAARGNYNFGCDPEAARAVLFSGAPLAIGTNDITEQVTLGHDDVARLRTGTLACQAAAEQLARYLSVRDRDQTPMYDPVALTLAYTDRFVTTRPVALTISTKQTADEPRLMSRAVLTVDPESPPIAHASVSVGIAAFKEHLFSSIGA